MRRIVFHVLLGLFCAGLVISIGCELAGGRNSAGQITQQMPGFDPNAFVFIIPIGHGQGFTSLESFKAAFAIGDGTIILTAAHCVDDLLDLPEKPISQDLSVISSYYGDIYNCKILAVDEEADVAVLKASWPVHPALDLAGEEELKAAKQIIIASRPMVKSKKSGTRLNRQIYYAELPILRQNENIPNRAIILKGTGRAGPGWSGSSMLIPESGKVAGVLSGAAEARLSMFGLLKISYRKDASGCSVKSIWALLQKNNLESAARNSPGKLEPVKDAQAGFSLFMDFFESLMNEAAPEKLHEIARQLVTVRPESAHAHTILAFIANSQAHKPDSDSKAFFALADSSYQRALQLDPNNVHIHAVYGDFLMDRSRNKEALAQTEAALAVEPNNPLALVNRLIVLLRTDAGQAEFFGRELIEKDPNNARYWFYYRSALSNLGRYEEALEAAQKAVELDPNGLYEGGLADALYGLDRLDEAERYYKQMTETCGCQHCWYKYALFLVNNRPGKLDEAKKALETAESETKRIRVSQQNLNSLKLRLLEKTSPEEAQILARKLLKDSPENGLYWWPMASILRALEKYEEAADAAQKAVDLSPEASYKPRLANTLAKAGRLEKAQQTYDEMLKEHPERGRYRFWYAEFLHDYFPDRIEETRAALEKARTASDRRWRVSDKELDELQDGINEEVP